MHPAHLESKPIDTPHSIRSIAILLNALPERTHRTLLGQLSADDKHRVLGEMACMGQVDASEQHDVLSVMRDQLQAETVVVEKVESEIRDEIVIGRARLSKKPDSSHRRPDHVVEERTVPRSRGASANQVTAAFDFIQIFGTENVGRALRRETAETIAWVLSAVDALTGAAILEHIDEAKRREALAQCASLREIDSKVLEMVANHLRSQLESLSESGAQITSESYRRFERRRGRLGLFPTDGSHRSTVVGKIQAQPTRPEPDRDELSDAEAERQAESVDRVLMALAPKDLCRALGMVTTEQAFLVLCGLPNATAENALALLPRRLSRKVRSDMRRLGQLQLSEIDNAKLVVAEVALRLTVAPQRMVG